MALDTQIKTQLQTYLQMLKEPVDLVASLDDSAGAKEMLALLEELAGMSDKINLSFDEHARKPSFSVKRGAAHKDAAQAEGRRRERDQPGDVPSQAQSQRRPHIAANAHFVLTVGIGDYHNSGWRGMAEPR